MPRAVVSLKDFKDLETRAFELKTRGKLFHGFVVKVGEKYFAYKNLCRHLPITLDANSKTFLSDDKKHIQCHMHGALYSPETGICVAGPCVGAKLLSLSTQQTEGKLVIEVPDEAGD